MRILVTSYTERPHLLINPKGPETYPTDFVRLVAYSEDQTQTVFDQRFTPDKGVYFHSGQAWEIAYRTFEDLKSQMDVTNLPVFLTIGKPKTATTYMVGL